jgi:ElaB/YqjD/DUF883 family membrane-anchored ribosome-binding protein
MNEEIEKVMTDIERSASACSQEVREKAAELCESIESYVRQEPLKSAIVAAGLGFVVGVLLTRR